MPYYHATFVERIPSILKHGLRSGYEKNWPEIADGVYLAVDPAIAVSIMLERYFWFGDPVSSPMAEIQRWRVIVIDDSRVRPELLLPDPVVPNAPEGVVLLYSGTIDVTGLPILDVDALGFPNPGELDVSPATTSVK